MFIIDKRLEEESEFLTTFSLSHVLLRNDNRFPWLILIPARRQLTEISFCSRLLKESFKATKINVGALGNIVTQLHIHIIARNEKDPCWPGPVWGCGTRIPYSFEALEERAHLLKENLKTYGLEK